MWMVGDVTGIPQRGAFPRGGAEVGWGVASLRRQRLNCDEEAGTVWPRHSI
jgi:hypothetical protein